MCQKFRRGPRADSAATPVSASALSLQYTVNYGQRLLQLRSGTTHDNNFGSLVSVAIRGVYDELETRHGSPFSRVGV